MLGEVGSWLVGSGPETPAPSSTQRNPRGWPCSAKSGVRWTTTLDRDRPVCAPAPQGLKSEQVADAPNPRGQCPSWVDSGGPSQSREWRQCGPNPAFRAAVAYCRLG